MENCGIVADLQQERKDKKFTIEAYGRQIQVNVKAQLSMVDGKLHSLLSGLGGTFCCLCNFSEKQCHDTEYISSGFPVNRSLAQTLEICEKNLHLEKNRRPGDYEERMGVTQQPITVEDISNLHPLHNVLRSFGWLYKICYHATAGHLKWSEIRLDVGNRVGESVTFLEIAKEQIQHTIKEATGICIEKPDPTGHGGTTTAGN